MTSDAEIRRLLTHPLTAAERKLIRDQARAAARKMRFEADIAEPSAFADAAIAKAVEQADALRSFADALEPK